MSGIWRLVHFLSFVAWIGGGLGVMMAGITMNRLDRSLWGGVADVQAALYRWLVAPGSLLTVGSGVVLTLRMYGALSGQSVPWLGMMQGMGLLGALVTLLGAMPAAGRLTRLEPLGETAAAFDAARSRLKITGMIGGILSLLALVAGALYRTG
ncbi:MAG: hypothetical protein ABIZ70_06850 [Gemmatimonadales bacterium]